MILDKYIDNDTLHRVDTTVNVFNDNPLDTQEDVDCFVQQLKSNNISILGYHVKTLNSNDRLT